LLRDLALLVAELHFSLQEEDSHAVTLYLSNSAIDLCGTQLDILIRPFLSTELS
jgi:hypothetical protein